MCGGKKLNCKFLSRDCPRKLIDDRHCVGFTNIKIYHGHGREGNSKFLADSDIVLSTYHTIAHEASDKKSPLWQIKWFRITLDEGTLLQNPP